MPWQQLEAAKARQGPKGDPLRSLQSPEIGSATLALGRSTPPLAAAPGPWSRASSAAYQSCGALPRTLQVRTSCVVVTVPTKTNLKIKNNEISVGVMVTNHPKKRAERTPETPCVSIYFR